MSDIWFPLLLHEHFRLPCVGRCSPVGNVSTVHVYIYIWRWKRRARTAIWHMVPITRTWAVTPFVHTHMLWTVVQLECDSVLYYYNVLSWILTVSSFVHELMFFNRKCKHRSRIYIYMTMKKARAHSHTTHGSHYSNMGSFIFRACTYVWKCKHRSRMYMTMKACLDRVHGEHGVQLSLGVTL